MTNVHPLKTKPRPPTAAPLPGGAALALVRRGATGWELLTVTRRHGTNLFMSGGKRDPLESAAENAVRETLEETGVRVPLIALRPLYEGLCPFVTRPEYVVTVFWALWDDAWGVPSTQEPGVVPRWAPLDAYLGQAEFADFDQRALACLSLP